MLELLVLGIITFGAIVTWFYLNEGQTESTDIEHSNSVDTPRSLSESGGPSVTGSDSKDSSADDDTQTHTLMASSEDKGNVATEKSEEGTKSDTGWAETRDASIPPGRAPSEPPTTGTQDWVDLEEDHRTESAEAPEEHLFDGVRIHEEAWARIREQPRLKSRLSTLIRRIEHFYVNEERIPNHTIRDVGDEVYKARLPNGLRIPFSFLEEEDSSRVLLLFWEVLSHEEGEDIHRDGYDKPGLSETQPLPEDWKGEKVRVEQYEEENDPYDPPSAPLYRVWEPEDEDRLEEGVEADLRWRLSPEQEDYCYKQGPVLLKGSAGSGKTTIALYRLLRMKGYGEEEKLYVTYTEYLKDYAVRRYQQLGAPDPDNLPTFLTIEELCRSFIPGDQERYPSSREFTYDAFKRIPAFGQFDTSLPLDLLWEEIRGVLKGAYQIVRDESSYLSRDEYLQIPSSQSLVPEKTRDVVYEAFQNYEQWLNDRDYWDELELAQEAFKRLSESGVNGSHPTFQQLVVDEVQDLTTYHVQLLLQLSENPYGLFMTGDAQQTIHPSRFEWQRVKTQLYEHTKELEDEKQYFEGPVKSVDRVSKNFRSPRSIVSLANSVADWRNEVLEEDNDPLDWIREEDPVCCMKPRPVSSWTDNDRFSHRLMVVVPNEQIKQEAQEEFGKGRVFTVHEAKGLEAAFVILWRFFSDEAGVWRHPHRSADPSSRDWKQRARYQVSLFTVAVTRAREQLFIIDEEVPKDWGPLSQTDFEKDSVAQSRLTAVLEIQSQSEDYLRLAQELEDRELYEQAAANYFEARHEKEAYRCQGIFAERNGKFGRAARMYEQAERYGDAARCYERVEHYQKAFELTLETDGGEGLPQVDDYLQEDRKLAKLDGDVSSAILKAIHNEHPDVTVATLFQYSSRRVGWHRYELGRTVDEVDTVSVRDVKEGGKQLQRALTQLRMKN